MKIIWEFKRTGKIVSWIITKTIFEKWEERGEEINHYTQDWEFFIKSSFWPVLEEYDLYVHWTDKTDDDYEVSFEYDTIEKAKQIMKYIKEFYAKECTDWEVLEVCEPEFKEWELVEVSDNGKDWYEEPRTYLATLSTNKEHKYLCVSAYYEKEYKKNKSFTSEPWVYIRKIQPKKTITIEATPEQEEAINNILWMT